MKLHNTSALPARRQRGVVMLFGLLALAIMLIGAAAMVRSMNTSLFNAGNLGFKRDMANQMERAVALVATEFTSGALADEVARQADVTTKNYSAQLLDSNAQGIPKALLDDALYATWTAGEIPVAGQQLTLRYVVDRLCTAAGAADATRCTLANAPIGSGGRVDASTGAERNTVGGSGAIAQRVIYRLSVRVTGPRNSQAFFQSTMTL